MGTPAAPPAESIPEAAERLTDELKPPAEPDPPKKKSGRGGRRPGAGRKPAAVKVAEAEAANAEMREARVGLLAAAITATFAPLIERAELDPPFTPGHGRALAEVWDPVIEMYAKDGGPWTLALTGTAVIMLPYVVQIAQRRGKNRSLPGIRAES